MDIINKGSVVISTAGRDSGNPFLVTDCDDVYAYLCDGKIRPVEKPKKKKIKHLRFLSSDISEKITVKLETGIKVENAEVRKALSKFLQEVL